jgi:hypothetical protein
MACLAAKPIVDGVEREFSGQLLVVRLNVQDPAGRVLARTYGSQYTPTYLFFDELGVEQWRSVGDLDPAQLQRSLTTGW